jgi:hypothetical protein
VVEVRRTLTHLGFLVVDLVVGTRLAAVGGWVPPRGTSTCAPIGGVNCGKTGRAEALIHCTVPDMVGGTGLAMFRDWVEVVRRRAATGSLRSADGARRAADFIGSGGRCAGWADTSEDMLVEDHAIGAAGKVGCLLMAQSFGVGHCE